MDQEYFQEPQIHNKEREGKHTSGYGELLGLMEVADKQSNDKQNVWQKINCIPEIIQVSFNAGKNAATESAFWPKETLVIKHA